MSKVTIKSVTKDFEAYKAAARSYLSELRFPQRRKLLTVEAADAQGKLNGMTIVELITVAHLTENTAERVYLTVDGKAISMWAVKISPPIPSTLL